MTKEGVGARILKIAAAGYPSIPKLPDPGARGYRLKLCGVLGVKGTETLRQWEQGISRPNKTAQARIATALQCKPADFMHGEGQVYRSAIADDRATELAGAIEMLDQAITGVAASARPELADLMRQWVIYGEHQRPYGTVVAKLLSEAGVKVDASPKLVFSREALVLAERMDQIKIARSRALLLTRASELLDAERDPPQNEVGK